jgi:oligopeptide transport system substrate-binding protein
MGLSIRRRLRQQHSIQNAARRIVQLALILLLFGCMPTAPLPEASVTPTNQADSVPTPQPPAPTGEIVATAEDVPLSDGKRYRNSELGVTVRYPLNWRSQAGANESTLTWLIAPSESVYAVIFYEAMPTGATLEQAAKQVRDATTEGVKEVKHLGDQASTLADGRAAWRGEYTGARDDGSAVHVLVASTARGGRLFSMMAFGDPDDLEREREILDQIIASIKLEAPQIYGIPRDQALVQLGGESNNPRAYDPATGGGDGLVFSGLVSFNPQLEIVPDLAESWEISPDGTVYTFHLRPNARFHDGKPVTAQDVIYSWQRAADPATKSDTVLTYLGDIVGLRARHEGKAEQIGGLQAIDEHTLQVTIDAPKPYFLMKLTYSTADVVDRPNVESGPEWYRKPNGTGPYKLVRWDRFKVQIYERNDNFYLTPPAIRHIVVRLYEGVGIRMYETGDVDLTGVSLYDVDRVRDPQEPLHGDLREGVDMCTGYVIFDTAQPPFDDPKVRQAFALAVDRQRYIDVVQRGVSIPAHGLYPPGLPGYTANQRGLDFDPQLARQRLAESTYRAADKLPPIVFTTSGFGSDVGPSVAALAEMWRDTLGVTIQIENLEPNKAQDERHAGNHGQLLSYGWCADYPDAENFADALFHSDAQQNLGHYSNPDLDRLLEQARVEHDVDKRLGLYQRAEQIIVEDAAGIFLTHGLSFVLIKPYLKGYTLTPIAVPIERYLSLDASQLE